MGKIIARPTVANVDITLADTEYEYALPVGTTRFSGKLRNLGIPLKICMVSGGSGTIYKNLAQGETWSEKDIKGSPNVLYFQSATATQVVEVLSWV